MMIEADKESALRVSQLADFMSSLVSANLGKLWIRGEVSNLRIQKNGNAYFSLKDSDAKINAVVMRFSKAQKNLPALTDGREILIFGRLSYYKKEGYLSFFVDEIDLLGEGYLKQKFEELKKKLGDEGLFDPRHKKNIPAYPTTVGVITSPTTAAFQDILNVTGRRNPGVEIILFGASVQGDKAASEIVRALHVANRFAADRVEVLLLTRGGGSIEDLWCFNEEIVARAIFESQIPVVSAVGHEIDYTIADYVSDLRAPTPSAGAEMVVKDREELLRFIQTLFQRAESVTLQKIENARLLLDSKGFDFLKQLLETTLSDTRSYVQNLKIRFESLRDSAFENAKNKIAVLTAKLEALDPMAILERGYSVTYDSNGRVLKDPADVQNGELILTKTANGELHSLVQKNPQ